MIIVVDSNLLFSAIISPNNRIAEILFSPLPQLKRISCYYAMVELFTHQPKIVTLSKLPVEKVGVLLHTILRQVEFFNENIIETQHWKEADRLTTDVDQRDISFVALTLQKDAWLWTGDKKLTNHVRAMGFDRVLNTEKLVQMLKLP